ncbi:MAG: hypothetical protein HUJ69_02840 [Lachnospiraceae bacterium]|nr:hypothetical protein [Lachnospiraceae bacterium]
MLDLKKSLAFVVAFVVALSCGQWLRTPARASATYSFTVTDDRGFDIDCTTDPVEIIVEKYDETADSYVDAGWGSPAVEGNTLIFSPSEIIPEGEEYSFRVTAPGGYTALTSGGTLTSGTTNTSIVLQSTASPVKDFEFCFSIVGDEGNTLMDPQPEFVTVIANFKGNEFTGTLSESSTEGYTLFTFDEGQLPIYEGETLDSLTVKAAGYLREVMGPLVLNENSVFELTDHTLMSRVSLVPVVEEISVTYGETISGISNLFSFSIPERTDKMKDVPYDGALTYYADQTLIEGDSLQMTGANREMTSIAAAASQTDMFAGARVQVPIILQPKALAGADFVFVIDSARKTYDGTTDAYVSGHLENAEGKNALLPGDSITFTARVVTSGANVGTYYLSISPGSVTWGGDIAYYSGYDARNIPVAFSVLPLAVTVNASEAVAMYGSPEWGALKEGKLPESWTPGTLISLEGGGTSLAAELAALDLSSLVQLSVMDPQLAVNAYKDVGVTSGALQFTLTGKSISNFTLVPGTPGNIAITSPIVTDDGGLWKQVMVDPAYSNEDKGYYVHPEGVIYLAESGRVHLTTAQGSDFVTVSLADSVGAMGSAAEGSRPPSRVHLETALGTRTDADPLTEGAQDNMIPEGALVIDGTAPAVSFNECGAWSPYVKAGDLPWAVASAFTVSVSDAQSGVSAAWYTILSVDPQGDKTLAELAAGASWSALSGDGSICLPDSPGYYAVLVQCADRVGNISTVASAGCIVDTAAPIIYVQGLGNDTHYKGEVFYSITVQDPRSSGSGGQGLFSPAAGLETLEVCISVDGVNKPYGSLQIDSIGYTGSFLLTAEDLDALLGSGSQNPGAEGDKRGEALSLSAAVPAYADSDTVLVTVIATDKAGNRSAFSRRICLDATAPAVSLSPPDLTAEAGPSLTISVEEKHFSEENFVYSLDLDGKPMTNLPALQWMQEGDVYKAVIPLEKDGYYSLSYSCSDPAGNETAGAETFKLNRGGSSFKPDSSTKEQVDQYYLQSVTDMVILEENLDKLTVYLVQIDVNGVLVTLKENEDYTVEVSLNGEGRQVYTYRIFAYNFRNTGIYDVLITSVDAAGNTQTNRMKDALVCFAVDREYPLIQIQGAENEGKYEVPVLEISVIASDNMLLSRVDIYVDEVLAYSFDEEEIRRLKGILPVSIEASDTYRSIMAVATDAAGNVTQTDPVKILVIDGPLLLPGTNIRLKGILGAILSLLIIGLYLRYMHREKRENSSD